MIIATRHTPVRDIPDGPESLSAAWLTAALRGVVLQRANVASIHVEPAGKGMAGRVVRVRLTYDIPEDQAPVTLIAKFPSSAPATREIASRLRIYEREQHFYDTLAERVGVPVPAMYFGVADGLSAVLLLEDVTGARAGDLLRGCSLSEASAIVEQIAGMHAAWWQSAELRDQRWLPTPNDPSVTALGVAEGPGAWRSFEGRFGRHMPPVILRLGATLSRDQSVVDRLSTAPQTLVHGDLRVNNVLFDEAGGPRAFIDWQTAVRGRGPIDIANLFVSSLQPNDRALAERELLPQYHELLVEGGVRDYSYDDCWLDYRLAVANQFSQIVILSSMLDVDEQLDDGVGAATGGRLVAALSELPMHDVLKMRPSFWQSLRRRIRRI